MFGLGPTPAKTLARDFGLGPTPTKILARGFGLGPAPPKIELGHAPAPARRRELLANLPREHASPTAEHAEHAEPSATPKHDGGELAIRWSAPVLGVGELDIGLATRLEQVGERFGLCGG